MFAMSVRVRPWSARSSPRSVGRVTTIVPSSWLMPMRVGTTWRSSPFGPETVTRPGSTDTSTPAGTSMGFLPIRLISLPDETDHFAADAFALGGAARDDAAGRGQDCGAHAAEHARQPVLAGVDPPARLGDALEVGQHALAPAAVLQLDDERRVGARLGDMEVADVALLLEDAGDLDLELRVRHLRAVVQRLVGVADPREHVGDRIGEHRRPLLPGALGQARDDALVGELPQADAAEAELPEDGARPTAAVAARVVPDLELLRPRGLDDQRLLRHVLLAPLSVGCERQAELGEEHARLRVVDGSGRDRDVEAADLVDAVVVDLGKDDLLADAERVVAPAVERIRVEAAEVADAWQRDRDEPVEELPHPVAAQGDLDADRHPLADLELGDRLAGAA